MANFNGSYAGKNHKQRSPSILRPIPPAARGFDDEYIARLQFNLVDTGQFGYAAVWVFHAVFSGGAGLATGEAVGGDFAVAGDDVGGHSL